MILRLQLLVIFTFSFFLAACTEDKNFDTDNKTVDISLDNAEEVTLGVIQATFLTHLYLPVFDFLDASDLPDGAVKVESIDVPALSDGLALSCSDFPSRTTDDVGIALYCFDDPDTPDSGVALYSFPAKQKSVVGDYSFPVEEEYVSGDRVTVQYEDFVNELGWVHNGQLTAKYTKIDGLSDEFFEPDSVSCLVNLQAELSENNKMAETSLLAELIDARGREQDLIQNEVLDNGVSLSSVLPTRDSNLAIGDIRLNSVELNSLFNTFDTTSSNLGDIKVIGVVADDVRFLNYQDELKIEVFGKIQMVDDAGVLVVNADGNPVFQVETDEDGEPILDDEENTIIQQSVLAEYVIEDDEKVIVINYPRDESGNVVTGINDIQVYGVEEQLSTQVNCQQFERQLSATLTGFSVKKEATTYQIDGALNMIDGTGDSKAFTHEIRDSNFTTTIKQENSIGIFKMGDFTIAKVQGSKTGSYLFDTKLSGSVESAVFPGLLTVSIFDEVIGERGDEHPQKGEFDILAQGLEQVRVVVEENLMLLDVDYNGDSTGNGRFDPDYAINTNWNDLLNRDFLKPVEE